jgi:hypothetical protein
VGRRRGYGRPRVQRGNVRGPTVASTPKVIVRSGQRSAGYAESIARVGSRPRQCHQCQPRHELLQAEDPWRGLFSGTKHNGSRQYIQRIDAVSYAVRKL